MLLPGALSSMKQLGDIDRRYTKMQPCAVLAQVRHLSAAWEYVVVMLNRYSQHFVHYGSYDCLGQPRR